MKLSPMFYQDRAADLAASQLALVVALAGKNNLISCMFDAILFGCMFTFDARPIVLTGIGHEKVCLDDYQYHLRY